MFIWRMTSISTLVRIRTASSGTTPARPVWRLWAQPGLSIPTGPTPTTSRVTVGQPLEWVEEPAGLPSSGEVPVARVTRPMCQELVERLPFRVEPPVRRMATPLAPSVARSTSSVVREQSPWAASPVAMCMSPPELVPGQAMPGTSMWTAMRLETVPVGSGCTSVPPMPRRSSSVVAARTSTSRVRSMSRRGWPSPGT